MVRAPSAREPGADAAMPRIRVLAVFGTRPQAIKMAPVVRRLQARRGFEPLLCVTGQPPAPETRLAASRRPQEPGDD